MIRAPLHRDKIGDDSSVSLAIFVRGAAMHGLSS
jgi:hypothetical protein